MIRPLLCVCLSACITLLTGCASIVGKSEYPVTINSQPEGANVSIVDETGQEVFNGTTPTIVTLKAGAGYFKGKNYTVNYTKPGYAQYSSPIERNLSGWYVLGNFVFGGVIGWLIVDPATGAMWTLPDEVTATLAPATPATSGLGVEQLHIVSIADLPAHLRAKMVRIN